MTVNANPRRSTWSFLWITLVLLGISLAAIAGGGIEGSQAQTPDLIQLKARVSAGPATAPVTVEPCVLLAEDFDDGISRWTKFLNYWRLTDAQWYWGQNDGYGGSGAANHECCNDPYHEAEDAVLMYLGEGAELWTDYRVEAKFNFHEGAGPVGLWVRGQYEPSDTRCQWMTGYYVVVGGRATSDYHTVKISQLQTATDCWLPVCDNPQNLYCFNNPHDLAEVQLPGSFTRDTWHTLAVEVRDANIKVWYDGELSLDYTDPKEPFLFGTVGLKTYKANWISYDDIVVTPFLAESAKAVNMPSVLPGQVPSPLYTVTFTNCTTGTVILDAITDTLPTGFQFLEMDPSSDWQGMPDDDVEPEIVWNGPITIPGSSELRLVYAVDVPLDVPRSTIPYVNVVVARSNGIRIGAASAAILVGDIDLAMNKSAWPEHVAQNDLITYTVVLTNSGHVPGTVELVTDTLDPSLTFVEMAAGSDVMTSPQQISGQLVWSGPLIVPALGHLTLKYRVETPESSEPSVPCNWVEALTNDGRLGPAEACVTVSTQRIFLPAIQRSYAPGAIGFGYGGPATGRR
jgi:uncharacterized repeat protein (TIGR01451 family)